MKIFQRMLKKSLENKNKNVIGLMRDELNRNIMKAFVELKAKTYNYLADENNESN